MNGIILQYYTRYLNVCLKNKLYTFSIVYGFC